MTAQHHPGDDLLLGYVTASLPMPMETAIAAHLTLCPRCRETTSALEVLGGEILSELEPAPLDEDALAHVLARLDEPAPLDLDSRAPVPEDSETARLVPAPLRALAGQSIKSLNWRRPLPGVTITDLASLAEDGAKARLVRTRAGGALPRHRHQGTELTLVLAGGFSDQHGHFRRGDLLVIEPGQEHRPIMDDDEDCLCFGVTDGQVVMTGVIGRIRQILGRY